MVKDKPDNETGRIDSTRILSLAASHAPHAPGVYMMMDASGSVIYVGKASDLKKRLSSYVVSRKKMSEKTRMLVSLVASVDTIVTACENEALILESNLIKEHRPRFNVILKDDKRYPSLRLDMKCDFPNLAVVRKIESDGAVYFGPFSSASAMRETLRIVNKTFPIRKCKGREVKSRKRPCINYQMKRCLGPCCFAVDRAAYMEIVEQVRMFLNGRVHELITILTRKMEEAAKNEFFEEAAQFRDRIFALNKVAEKQAAVMTDLKDRDVFAGARSENTFIAVVMLVRKGHLVGMRRFMIADTISSSQEILSKVIEDYYRKADFIPPEILTAVNVSESKVIEAWLREKASKKVRIIRPRRGGKLRLVNLAVSNAQNALKQFVDSRKTTEGILEELKKKLGLPKLPHRIECIDNSGLFGSNMVSGMVAFVDAQPFKEGYRRFRIRNIRRQDDYESMRQTLLRRFKRTEDHKGLPDLLLVDGGRAQLAVACRVIKELELTGLVSLAAIAKPDKSKGEPADKIFIPGRVNPVLFHKDDPAFKLLQRIRDEAHRFTLSYHRKLRGNISLESALDGIPGIGPARKQALLQRFGSITAIRKASIEELASVRPMNRWAALNLKKAL